MTQQIETMVSLLKARVRRDLGDTVRRDEALLLQVCRSLDLPPDPVNCAQVATLLGVMNVPTHQEYPKDIGGVIVNNADEEAKAIADAKPTRAA